MEKALTLRERWLKDLSFFEELYSRKETSEFSKQPQEIIKSIKALLNEKVTFYLIGQSKAGKSKLLNALIGKDFLEMDEQNCTFFGLKIQASRDNQIFFQIENQEKQLISEEELKRLISEINTRQRDLMIEGNTIQKALLLTRLKAFRKANIQSKINDAYDFLELVDLPGVTDNILGRQNDSQLNIVERAQNFAEIQEQPREKRRFNQIINELSPPDGLIILFSCDQFERMREFNQYFLESMFQGGFKGYITHIIEKERLIIALNKSDLLSEEAKSEQEYDQLSSDKIRRVSNEFLSQLNSFYSSQGPPAFLEENNINLLSAEKAFNNVFLTRKKEEELRNSWKNMDYDPPKIQSLISSIRKKKEENDNYEKSEKSGFDPFLGNLSEKIREIFSEKLEKPINEKFEQLKRAKERFDQKFVGLIDHTEIFQSKWKLIEENIRKESEGSMTDFSNELNQFKKDLEAIIIKNRDQAIKDSKMFNEIISSIKAIFQEFFQKIISLLKNFQTKIENFFKEKTDLVDFFREPLDQILKEAERSHEVLTLTILFAFLPENINYFQFFWNMEIVQKIFGNKYQRNWNYFLAEYEVKMQNTLEKIEVHFNSLYKEKFMMVVEENLKIIKLVNFGNLRKSNQP